MKKNLFLVFCILGSINANCQINNKDLLTRVTSDFNIQNTDSLIIRLKTVNNDIEKNGIRYFLQENSNLLTGYSYGEFYDWDLYFENIYMSYFGMNEYCFTNLKAFLKRQHLNGFISRTLKEPRPYQHFKPFLAQIALLGSVQRNDFIWLNEVTDGAKNKGIAEGGVMNEENFINGRSYYQRLKEYLNFWFWYQDFDKNGLPVWNSSDHSGMDNQVSRSGNLNAFRYEGVDLACYLYRELHAMAALADKLGLSEDVKMYNDHATKLIKQINITFWDEKDGFYYDRDEQTGKPVKVKSVAGFMPLFIGAASKQQADRLVKEHLLNKNEFWTDYPIPAYSKSEPDYNQNAVLNGECNWRGTAWIPTNYMVFHGLMDYGYTDIAKELAHKTFDMAFVKNKTTREYYNAETGAGKGLNPFWGWSTLAYFIPFEYELKYNPTDLNNKEIRPIGSEKLGIPFRNIKITSEYSVSRLGSPMSIDANWNKPQWKNTKFITIANYMGKLPIFKPTVQAKMMYDSDNLYVIFHVTDSVIRCLTKEINGPVWEDNAVEFFFSPDAHSPLKYFNLEMNCGGVPLMHYNTVANKEITELKREEIKEIEIAHSYTPALEKERFGNLTWTLEYKIPLNLLEKYSNVTHPAKGITWRANFYKIAHKSSDPHYISWSFIDIAPDDVDMHRPEFFGILKFE
jgi:putative isomerase